MKISFDGTLEELLSFADIIQTGRQKIEAIEELSGAGERRRLNEGVERRWRETKAERRAT